MKLKAIKKKKEIWQAFIDILPLAISVIPWGVLCGSLAIKTGFSSIQAQCMSLFVFAGAVQLSSISIIGLSGGLVSIINSTTIISSRHLLYSASFSEGVKVLSFPQRILIAFLLTDEMFAVTDSYKKKVDYFPTQYAITSGLTFYFIWNISSFFGIYIGTQANTIEALGLEFAIASTFIAMVIPSINSPSILMTVLSSGLSATVFHYLSINNGLIFSGFIGMICGYFVSSWYEKNG